MSKVGTAVVAALALAAAAGSASAQQQDWIVPFPYPSAFPASSGTFGYLPATMTPRVATTTFYQAPATSFYQAPVTSYYQAPAVRTVTTVRSRPGVYGYRAFPGRTVTTTRRVRAPVVVNNYYYQAPAAASWFQPTPWVFGATQTAGW